MTLQELYDAHELLSAPDKAEKEELDEQIFMVLDLETMVMAYTEAMLKGVDPKFTLDTDNLDRMANNIKTFTDLSESDQGVQQELLTLLDSLRRIRDLIATCT